MRDLSRQANQGMRLARRNFDQLAGQVMQQASKQQRETQQAFMEGYQSEAGAGSSDRRAPVEEKADEWNWDD